jgi:hypothetical protein
MAKIPAFHSIHEDKKPPRDRVHHNDDACPAGIAIPNHERCNGTCGYRLCKECARL